MNDASYRPYAPEVGAEYEKNMRLMVDGAGLEKSPAGKPVGVD